jgi:hypothetical protein
VPDEDARIGKRPFERMVFCRKPIFKTLAGYRKKLKFALKTKYLFDTDKPCQRQPK